VILGTTVNYFLGYYIGDAFIEKYGKYFFIKKEAYHKAQKLFIEDANFYTFFGRLIPVVRQLISIPAGMARMNYWKFLSLSLAGSALWLMVLIAL
jgi:membrane protein DedA with SNARE-associated domain